MLAKYVGEGRRIESLEDFLKELEANYGIQDEHKRGLRHFIDTEAPDALKDQLGPFLEGGEDGAGSPLDSFIMQVSRELRTRGEVTAPQLKAFGQKLTRAFGGRDKIQAWLGQAAGHQIPRNIGSNTPLARKINGVLKSFRAITSPSRPDQRKLKKFVDIIGNINQYAEELRGLAAVQARGATAKAVEGKTSGLLATATGAMDNLLRIDWIEEGKSETPHLSETKEGGKAKVERHYASITAGHKRVSASKALVGLSSHQEQELALLIREALQDRGQYDRIQRDITFQALFTLYVREEVRESLASMFGEKFDMSALAQTHSTLAGQAAAHKAIQDALGPTGGLRGGAHAQRGGAKTPQELKDEIERLTEERAAFKARLEGQGIGLPTEEQKAAVREARQGAQAVVEEKEQGEEEETKEGEGRAGRRGSLSPGAARKPSGRCPTIRSCPVPTGDNTMIIVYSKTQGRVLGTFPSGEYDATTAARLASGNLLSVDKPTTTHGTHPSAVSLAHASRPAGQPLGRIGTGLSFQAAAASANPKSKKAKPPPSSATTAMHRPSVRTSTKPKVTLTRRPGGRSSSTLRAVPGEKRTVSAQPLGRGRSPVRRSRSPSPRWRRSISPPRRRRSRSPSPGRGRSISPRRSVNPRGRSRLRSPPRSRSRSLRRGSRV